ncbi:MAG: hypothetical protein K2H38_07610 [Muribaculaceae bacterium]|nr:hypothetical protein [Muribaculaceae bacterium]
MEKVANPDDSVLFPYKYDFNNDVTAQVEILAEGIKFVEVEGNAIGGIQNFKNRSILYLCDGSRHIRLFSEGNLPLDIDFSKFEDTKRGVKGGELYLLKISKERQKQSFALGSRILAFKMEGPLDSLIVNGVQWPIENQVSQKLVPFGEYTYKAFSNGQFQKDGTVTLTEGLGSKIVKIPFE